MVRYLSGNDNPEAGVDAVGLVSVSRVCGCCHFEEFLTTTLDWKKALMYSNVFCCQVLGYTLDRLCDHTRFSEAGTI